MQSAPSWWRNHLGASSALTPNNLEPESTQSEEYEDSPEEVLKDLSPGPWDASSANCPGSHIPDGLLDPNELPNDAEIVDNLHQHCMRHSAMLLNWRVRWQRQSIEHWKHTKETQMNPSLLWGGLQSVGFTGIPWCLHFHGPEGEKY